MAEGEDELTATAAASKRNGGKGKSEEDSHPFFKYYAQLAHQQNMLQDHVRTGTYEKAILSNPRDFKDKVVLDVGTGSGILALFAAKAGAKRVYAVEASDMAEYAVQLVKANGYEKVISVIKGKLEDIDLPEKVDCVISEPMGFLLVHERMLESYVLGRIRFLKPGGRMFPTTGTMFFLPYSDWSLFNEQTAKCEFWNQRNFHGVDVTTLKEKARLENFSQAVVGCFDPSIFIASQQSPATYTIDFTKVGLKDMHSIHIDFEFEITDTAIMHGFGCWFDVDFVGSNTTVTLSTSPTKPTTHWYQCRLMLLEPLAVNATQVIHGTIDLNANEHFSYDVDITVRINGTDIVSKSHTKLQDQMYHYLTNPNAQSTVLTQYDNWVDDR